MKKIFKNIKGETIDVVPHTMQILSKTPNIQIHIGTDSQRYGDGVVYVTAVAYCSPFRKGVHYIIAKEKHPPIKDNWTRLFREAQLSIETAEWLTSNINVKVEIDMDYNSKKGFESNKLVTAARGWAESLGYKVNIKPHKQIATHAADAHC